MGVKAHCLAGYDMDSLDNMDFGWIMIEASNKSDTIDHFDWHTK